MTRATAGRAEPTSTSAADHRAPRRGASPSGRTRRVPIGPELVSGLLAAVVFCLAGAFSRTYPFGPLSRSTNDLGTQFIPLYAHLRDLLVGDADGDLLFNWGSALGVPFLPDYAFVLASPASLLVVLFPRERIDLAVFVITVVHLALAAAVMTAYLRRIAPGPALVAAAMGAAYAVCGWAVDDAAYVPMWLVGLIGLPLMALAGDLVVQRRRVGAAPLLVAVVWIGNFYTGYMATIGAAVLILVRLVVLWPGARHAAAAAGRLAVTLLLGVALAAPLLAPTVRAAGASQPSPPGVFTAHPWSDVLVRFLPLTEGVGVSPSVYVAAPVLLLALALPWHRGLDLRLRVAHVAALLLVLLSLQWAPTHAVWHGFDVPNGSPFRQAFVVCGLVVVLAWQAVAHRRPRPPALLAGAGCLALVALASLPSELGTDGTLPVLLVGTALTLLVGVLGPGRYRASLAVLLLSAVLLEGTATAVVTDQLRRERLSHWAPWSPELTALREAVTEPDRWPGRRTSPRANRSPNNDPLLVGGQGTSYYSSTIPQATSQTLRSLGIAWYGWGRSFVDTPDPGLTPLLGIGARGVAGDGATARVEQEPAVPLVTLRPQGAVPTTPVTGGPFEVRNLLWGAPVYEVPEVEVRLPGGAVAASVATRVAGEVSDADPVVLRARCAPGSLVQLNAPDLTGEARLGTQAWVEALARGARRPGVNMQAAPIVLGPVPATGEVVIEVRGGPSVLLPPQPIGCLDLAARDAAVQRLSEDPARLEVGGHSLTATWPGPVRGLALVSVSRVSGWQCSAGADGAWSTPAAAAGFVAVPLDGESTFTCRFRPPGLRLGLAVFAAALLALAAGAAIPRVVASRSRRRGGGSG